MNTQITHRIKSFLWRASGMTVVAVLALVVQSGDIFTLDYKMLTNFVVITFLGLVVGEITKFLNTEK